MSLFVNYGCHVFTLPYEAVIKNISTSSAEQLRVLLYICANENFRKNPTEYKSLATEETGLSWKQIDNSITYWCQQGVISRTEEKTDKTEKNKAEKTEKKKAREILLEVPSVSNVDTALVIEQNSELCDLIEELENLFGKLLSSSEINKLVSIYNYLGLKPDYIIEIGKYCVEIDKKSVAYLTRVASTFFDKGIVTYDELRDHFESQRRKNDTVNKIRKLFGIGSRALISKEERFISLWLDKYKISFELIEHAYELTIKAINEPSFDYCNGIIKKWHNSGVVTVDEAKESEQHRREKKKNEKQQGFDVDEFMELALKRSYKKKDEL